MRATIVILLALVLAACSRTDPSAEQFGDTGRPDEVIVTPSAPLVVPPTLALPRPTPGGVNRADAASR